MKFPLSWLKEHLDTDLDVAQLVDAMTMAGLEVEDVDDPAAKLASFTVAHVVAADKHPDADKLKVCRVATKDGEKQIVCGAPNARAGLKGVYAPLGTFIPGLDFALDAKPRKIRGVESHGMLCSSKELEIGDDHDGIIDLEGDWPVGAPAAEALGLADPVIDFEVTPNRPDWLGVVGIARDLAAAGAGAFIDGAVAPIEGAYPCPVDIKIDDQTACPAFAGRVVRGVKNGPSPEWLQKRLKAVGLRPINILVDVTNFMSLGRARPLHVYDVAKLTGAIRARLGEKGETFLALDGREYEATPDMCVIADDARVLGLGGVMGGEYSGCELETTDVFIESALFDPLRTARTGRATGITSDAQYRFARGVDPASVLDGLERATRLILDLCGGEASEVKLAGAIPGAPKPVDFPVAEIKRLTGLEIPATRVTEILASLGFAVKKGKAGRLAVQPPTWRADIQGAADLVEEVARIVGYDHLPAIPMPRVVSVRRAPALDARQRRVSTVRRTLPHRGLMEAITWSFARADQAKLFGAETPLMVANPISSELDAMRPSALVHLALAAQKNADKGFPTAALYEVGPIYRGPAPEDQTTVAAGVRRSTPVRHWQGPSAPDVFTVKADALAALQAAGAPVDKLRTDAPASPWFHPGRSGRLQLGPKMTLAEFGELHPRVLKALGVDAGLLAFEVFLDAVPPPRAAATKSKGAHQPSELMPVTRDFAFVVDAGVAAGDLARAVQGADKELIVDVSVFDVFAGAAIGAGKKSIAVEVTLQPRAETLDDAALEAVSKRIVAAVEKAVGASLRA